MKEVLTRMGYVNVTQVFVQWSHLPDRAYRLLIYMALTARDEDTPPVYWGGREMLSKAIGRQTPPEPAKSDSSARALEFRRARKADFEAVRSGMNDLLAAGAVRVEKSSAPGQNARYALTLDARTGQGHPAEQARLTLPTGQAHPANRPGSPWPLKEEPQERAEGTTTSPEVTTSRASEITYAEANSILQALPDLGSAFLSRTPESESLSTRVVMAALMAIAERTPA